MRLTRYDDENRYYRPCDYESDKQSTILKLCKKLGQLESIEEELGIDLITLFNALKNGFWYKEENDIVHISKNDYLLSSGAIHFAGKGLIFAGLFLCNKDYGKTWALTKEELL